MSLNVLLVACFMFSMVMARPFDPNSALVARLKLEKNEQGLSTCWDSLLQLQACTSEVILFFMNGETYLGKSCCKAIKIIQRDCWPSMMTSLGFTNEEFDILRGYCDASTAPAPPHHTKSTTTAMISSHEVVP